MDEDGGAATVKLNVSVKASSSPSSVYVSPSGSDSSGAGTASSPFKTLHKAQAVVRSMPAADRAGTVVNVMEGSYYLGEARHYPTGISLTRGP